MTITQGVIMGVVQGLTEFLPVSSSGHLAAARHILHAGLAEDVGFEVAVHVGTLIAVLIFFRERILRIFSESLSGEGDGRRWLGYIFIGTIPAGVIGIAFKDQIETLFNNMTLVGIAWLVTAILLFVSERYGRETTSAGKMGYGRAFGIGCAQAFAIIPGISRSGSTIAAGLLAGVEKKSVVDFVFILSLPAVGGAALLTAKDWFAGDVSFGLAHLAGGLAAGISGYWAIMVLLKTVSSGKLSLFAIYCAIAGIIALIFG